MICENIGRGERGALTFAGHDVSALAEKYGTPLYLMDEERIRRNCRMYLDALREHLGENAHALYAGKAASFRQIYRIAAEEGMDVDAVSLGEPYTALSASFPAERSWFHGKLQDRRGDPLRRGKGRGDLRCGQSGRAVRPAGRVRPPGRAAGDPAAHHPGHRPPHL